MGLIAWIFGKGISCGELHRRMAAGEKFLVVDVRTEAEFRGPGGRIPGAKLMPLSTVAERAPGEIAGTGRAVITVCSHGLRSMVAQRSLKKLGIESWSLQGGMKAWTGQGFEVIRDTKVSACAAQAPGGKPC